MNAVLQCGNCLLSFRYNVDGKQDHVKCRNCSQRIGVTYRYLTTQEDNNLDHDKNTHSTTSKPIEQL